MKSSITLSKITKSLIPLVLAAFLLWTVGCSSSQSTAISEKPTPTEAAKPDSSAQSDKSLLTGVLVLGGIALTVGGIAYVASKIHAATHFSSDATKEAKITIGF